MAREVEVSVILNGLAPFEHEVTGLLGHGLVICRLRHASHTAQPLSEGVERISFAPPVGNSRVAAVPSSQIISRGPQSCSLPEASHNVVVGNGIVIVARRFVLLL